MPRDGIRKTLVAVRKSSVALCHGVPLTVLVLASFFARSLTIIPRPLLLNRTETLTTQATGDRESSVALCHGVALKKKTIGRRPRERCVSFPRFGIDNALQDRKERKTKGDKERAESGSLCCFN